MRAHGVPAQILTDNGKVFTGRFHRPPVEVLFEISKALLRVPKFFGETAKPQGWFSGVPCAKRFTKLPVSVKMSM